MSTYSDASLIFYPSGYKESKLYSLKPTDGSGDLTFTRASTATRVNSSGLIESVATGVPRIDYTGGGCGKLLLEPQRTNLVTYSEEFNNWLIPPTFTAIETASLKGSIIFSNFGNAVSQGITLTSNADTTISVFAKKSNWNFLQIRTVNFDASASARTWFDLLNGTVGSTDIPSRHFNQSIEDFGGGWYRCSLTFKSITDLTGSIQLAGSQSNSSTISGANSGEDIFFDMSQVELGSYPTSYIPTTSTAVTRVEDSATKTGISSLIGQSEGTLFIDMVPTNVSGQGRYMNLYNGANNNNGWNAIISQGTTPNTFRFYGDGFDFSGGACLFGVRVKVALAYKNGVLTSAYVNGASVGTLTAVTTGKSYDTLTLGEGPFGVAGSCNVNESIIFPTALTNAELATLTTI
jgi:hypothetical protein